MRITSIAGGFAAIAALWLLAIGPAAAQQVPIPPKQFGPRITAAKPGAAVEVIATHGAWKIQCEKPQDGQAAEGQAEGLKQCGMVQGARSEKNPKAGLTLVLIRGKQADKQVTMIRVMAPIGVFLPTGVALEIDGAAVGRVPFTRCLPQFCMAFAEASPETLEKMKKGTAANFIIYEAPGLGLPMRISLEGFSAAFDALENL
ncbi:MAG: invasion associated locus B family protein [Hyphomicrobiales bacterium]